MGAFDFLAGHIRLVNFDFKNGRFILQHQDAVFIGDGAGGIHCGRKHIYRAVFSHFELDGSGHLQEPGRGVHFYQGVQAGQHRQVHGLTFFGYPVLFELLALHPDVGAGNFLAAHIRLINLNFLLLGLFYFYRLIRIVDVGVGGNHFAVLLGSFEGYQALAGQVAGIEGEH